MNMRNWFRTSPKNRTITGSRTVAAKRTPRLTVETLEDRTVPTATISVANATLNEVGSVSAFVAPGSGGLSQPKDLVVGPDGNVYVASRATNSVLRYDATS